MFSVPYRFNARFINNSYRDTVSVIYMINCNHMLVYTLLLIITIFLFTFLDTELKGALLLKTTYIYILR